MAVSEAMWVLPPPGLLSRALAMLEHQVKDLKPHLLQGCMPEPSPDVTLATTCHLQRLSSQMLVPAAEDIAVCATSISALVLPAALDVDSFLIQFSQAGLPQSQSTIAHGHALRLSNACGLAGPQGQWLICSGDSGHKFWLPETSRG